MQIKIGTKIKFKERFCPVYGHKDFFIPKGYVTTITCFEKFNNQKYTIGFKVPRSALDIDFWMASQNHRSQYIQLLRGERIVCDIERVEIIKDYIAYGAINKPSS